MNARRPPPLQPGAKAWTPAEDAILRARYLTEGAAAMARALGRRLTSVHKRTQRLGLYTHRRWTPAEDARLRLCWGEADLAETARRMGRTVLTTWWRAQKLGLPLGCPQGWEYLTAAAKRTGYETGGLRPILRWAGVPIRFSISRPTTAPRRCCIVDPDQVDAAVARWLKTESLTAAARRHGIAAETLERWLRLSGKKLPAKPRAKKRWRVPSDIIDAVVAQRRAVVPIRAAALAAGLQPSTLRRRALAAGVPRTPGKLWLLDAATVERLARAA